MLTAASIFTILAIIANIILIPVEFLKNGSFGFVYLIIAIPGIVIECINLSKMNNGEKSVAVIVLSFLFTNIFAGVFYSVWYGMTPDSQPAKVVDPESMKTDWMCPNCGKEVKFVKHCACGYDFNPSVDKMIVKKEVNPSYVNVKPVSETMKTNSISRYECPCCGAFVNVKDVTCFNCGAVLNLNEKKSV